MKNKSWARRTCLQSAILDPTLSVHELTSLSTRTGNQDLTTEIEIQSPLKLKKEKKLPSQCSPAPRKKQLLVVLQLKKSKVPSKTTISHRWRSLPQPTKWHDLERRVQLKELTRRIDLVQEESMVTTITELSPSQLRSLSFKKTLKLLLKRKEWSSLETRARPLLVANPTSLEVKTRNEQWLVYAS